MIEQFVDKKNQKRNILSLSMIYFILSLATMSDILRIPGTPITFFRLCIPIAVLIIAMYPTWAKKFIFISVSFVLINFFLNVVFYKVYRPDLMFQFSRFLMYCVLYISIFIILILVCIVKEISGKYFEKDFVNWISIMGGMLLIILIMYNRFPDFFGDLPIDNPNNYGCYIAAVFPFYLVRAQKSRGHIKYLNLCICIVCLYALYTNDSKVSLLGVIIQMIVLFCITSTYTVKTFFMKRFMIPIGAILSGFLLIVLLNPSINGYPLKEITLEPINRIITGNPYPTYTASISFRTNTTIFALNNLWELKGLGLGAGNIGILLKSEFPNLNPAYVGALNASALSLHNSWLEFMNDLGIIGIVILIYPVCYAIKIYFSKCVLGYIEKVMLLFILSCPVWLIGPSGVYTQYFLFAIIMFLIISRKESKSL